MKAICPKNGEHDRFRATAVVEQEWVVDRYGEFEKELYACLEVVRDPDPSNGWECMECGSEAVFEEG